MRFGNALSFDGDDRIRIERINNSLIDPLENITVSAWVKNTARNDNYMKTILITGSYNEYQPLEKEARLEFTISLFEIASNLHP